MRDIDKKKANARVRRRRRLHIDAVASVVGVGVVVVVVFVAVLRSAWVFSAEQTDTADGMKYLFSRFPYCFAYRGQPPAVRLLVQRLFLQDG